MIGWLIRIEPTNSGEIFLKMFLAYEMVSSWQFGHVHCWIIDYFIVMSYEIRRRMWGMLWLRWGIVVEAAGKDVCNELSDVEFATNENAEKGGQTE